MPCDGIVCGLRARMGGWAERVRREQEQQQEFTSRQARQAALLPANPGTNTFLFDTVRHIPRTSVIRIQK